MSFALQKVFFPLTIRTFSIAKQNIIYSHTTILCKFYANSFSFQIMSASSNAGTDSNDLSRHDRKSEGKENADPGIIKSENDSMEYRLIQLDNGLKAILVSDVLRIVDLNAMSDAGEQDDEDTEEESSSDSFEEVQNDPGSESKAFKKYSHKHQYWSREAKHLEKLDHLILALFKDDAESKHVVREAEEKMAACALCVGVGSFSDPPDIPGLAHFLEHMVFMGSTKYPQENGFDEFIKKHGGSDNGSTECETTTFYLECSEKYLKEGMDRFAQFFISPLMKREAMTREREIIHSEFEMFLPLDETRREQILGSLAPSGHPAAKFLWGNLTTLANNVDDNVLYERVHEFRKRHYSAHRMTVAVQARLPLDTLEEYVRMSFSDIPSNYLGPEDFSGFVNTYGTPEKFNKILWVKPIKDICQVHLTWVLPSYMKEYKSRPLDYIAWLIGHEGEGSLLSYFRKKVWALECEAGNDESGFEYNSIYSLFSTTLTLTEEGYRHINDVISLVFGYISMLRKKCPNKDIYDELHTISETNFRYKTEIPSASYVEILAESMHFYEPEHYIAGGELYLQYKPELITEILDALTPDNVNVIIYSKENRDSFYDRVEPWFQTKHKIEDIPPEWKKKWLDSETLDDFHIPLPNPYLTTNFTLLPPPETNPPYPVKILDNELLELWYRQDVKFKQPLAYFSFYIISPILKSDPLKAVLLDLLAAYFEAKFVEHIFSANEAGLYCDYFPADLGFSLQFSGYSEKLPLFFDEILKLIHKCYVRINEASNSKLFEAIKKGRSQSYYNKFLKPRKLVKMARLALLVENCWTSVEHLEVMKHVTLDMLHAFAAEFFGGVRILGLIQGNVSKEMSLELCEKFETILHCSPLRGEKPQVRVAKLSPGEVFLRLKSFNDSDSNSVIVNYYQVGQGNIRSFCIVDLLMMLMDEPLFDNLRTKQQIGYDVHCLLRDTFGVLAFSITVFFQSAKFHPDEVDERIEAFLQSFLKTLRAMTKREWEETKESLILLKSSADLQLQDEVKRNFSEICTNEYVFDRLQKEVETIPDISHKELCNWFADHVASGKNFRKLSVQVVGDASKSDDSSDGRDDVEGKSFKLMTMTSDNDKKDLFVTDIVGFKRSREFYPVKRKS